MICFSTNCIACCSPSFFPVLFVYSLHASRKHQNCQGFALFPELVNWLGREKFAGVLAWIVEALADQGLLLIPADTYGVMLRQTHSFVLLRAISVYQPWRMTIYIKEGQKQSVPCVQQTMSDKLIVCCTHGFLATCYGCVHEKMPVSDWTPFF